MNKENARGAEVDTVLNPLMVLRAKDPCIESSLFLTYFLSATWLQIPAAYVIIGLITCKYIVPIFSGWAPHVCLQNKESLLKILVALKIMWFICTRKSSFFFRPESHQETLYIFWKCMVWESMVFCFCLALALNAKACVLAGLKESLIPFSAMLMLPCSFEADFAGAINKTSSAKAWSRQPEGSSISKSSSRMMFHS
ncbi:hypothetical protein KGM_209477 [Danaus plexippus plexippus]|uniref:Uncharacterized protein n=1 Tax=Danaus plexippus plexippus TaxID=278856 RepID=A0A212F691_DANPL|nr:hypothetical protein KGM_209477 [Danaus plexippus plexippus]